MSFVSAFAALLDQAERVERISTENDTAAEGTVLAEWFKVTCEDTGRSTECLTIADVESFTRRCGENIGDHDHRVVIVANPCHCDEAAVDCRCGIVECTGCGETSGRPAIDRGLCAYCLATEEGRQSVRLGLSIDEAETRFILRHGGTYRRAFVAGWRDAFHAGNSHGQRLGSGGD